MSNATINLPIPAVEILPEQRDHWLKYFHDVDLPIVAQSAASYEMKRTPEVGQAILDHLNQKHGLSLTFQSWYSADGGQNIRCTSKRGGSYIVSGDWMNGHSYFARGILKYRNPFRPIGILCNGQAAKNAIQVAHDGESDPILWPQMKALIEAHRALPRKPT